MSGLPGTQRLEDSASHLNAYQALINRALSSVHTGMMVQVIAVNPSGVGPGVGSVDVMPMVLQVNGAGYAPVPNAPIYGLAYSRLQGGMSAVIMDPAVGDIGASLVMDRDISRVKATQAPALPDSFRQHNAADGVYFGGPLNGTPTQYVEFLPNAEGINVVSPQKVQVTAPTIDLTASTLVQVTAPAVEIN